MKSNFKIETIDKIYLIESNVIEYINSNKINEINQLSHSLIVSEILNSFDFSEEDILIINDFYKLYWSNIDKATKKDNFLEISINFFSDIFVTTLTEFLCRRCL